jgi:molecular chaperone Hsp33
LGETNAYLGAMTFPNDDMTAQFLLPDRPVVGRIVRVGAVAEDILSRHAYPEPVANLLGETIALAALVGASLKFEGRLIVQAQGEGPVSYVVVDYDTSGALRGYCKFDADRVAEASQGFVRPGAQSLLGQGAFVMTIDRGEDLGRSQGTAPIEGETLALCAETYFAQSEQLPTRVVLGVSRIDGQWRAGGLMVQLIAPDETRGSTEEAWDHARAIVNTLGEDELTDPKLSAEALMFRLFHEDGVRLLPGKPLAAQCRCSQERVEGMMRSFDKAAVAEMVEPDGMIHVTCEFCSRTYFVSPEGTGANA